MNNADQKIVQYLEEARAMENALVTVLESQIAMAPRGRVRDGLERHLDETRRHASQVGSRLDDYQQGRNPLQLVVDLTETVVGATISQTMAISKLPFDLLRGSGGEKKVLKNAKDACASEALEIATYVTLERVANDVGDEKTAKLAASIRSDEERMLQFLLAELPALADKVVGADVRGESSYDATKTGAADAVRDVASAVKERADDVKDSVSEAANRTQRAASQASSELAGQPWEGYDEQSAAEIEDELDRADEDLRRKVIRYEKAHKDRVTVIRSAERSVDEEKDDKQQSAASPASSGTAGQPWSGYDEQWVPEIEDALDNADEDLRRKVVRYEKAHKNRVMVLRSAERKAVEA